MTVSGATGRATAPASTAKYTIGDVLAHLKADFPDLTISKIRFLEDQGLVTPERTPSGYRKYASGHVSRLRYVLSQQRDHYLPLKVIKEQLEAIDRGLVPPGTSTDSPRASHLTVIDDNAPTADNFRVAPASLRMTRDELLNASGLRGDQLGELEQFGLIAAKPGGVYDDDALLVAKIVVELARYGLEGRHLRMFRTAAEREVGLFSQIVGQGGRKSAEARARAEETARELAAQSVRLHAALVQIGLREIIGGS